MQHIAQAHAEWVESLTPEQRAKYEAAHQTDPPLTTEVTVKVFLTVSHDGSATDELIRDEAIRDVEQTLLGAVGNLRRGLRQLGRLQRRRFRRCVTRDRNRDQRSRECGEWCENHESTVDPVMLSVGRPGRSSSRYDEQPTYTGCGAAW